MLKINIDSQKASQSVLEQSQMLPPSQETEKKNDEIEDLFRDENDKEENKTEENKAEAQELAHKESKYL